MLDCLITPSVCVSRFNELRKVRNKPKAAGTERPFSRMYNFFVLEQGDKWAKTGTRFKPRNAAGYPRPEHLKSADSKKERPVKHIPSVTPQSSGKSSTAATVSARSQESLQETARPTDTPKRQAPTPKMVPQSMRVAGARSSHILGNRPSPPPPSMERAHILGNRPSPPPPSMERARLNAMLDDGDDTREVADSGKRIQHILGKRHRDYDDADDGLGVGGGLVDVPSGRRLRVMESSIQGTGYLEHYTYSRYHHQAAAAAAALSADEQAYLYRMRPEVRDEVMAPLLRGVRRHGGPSLSSLSGGMHAYVGDALPAARRMDMMQCTPMHRQAHLHPYRPVVRIHAPHAHLRDGHAWDGLPDYGRRGHVTYHQHHIEGPVPACAEEAEESASRCVEHEDEWKTDGGRRGVEETTEEESGFSSESCWSTPDGVQSICEDFVGSPLDLGEGESLAALHELLDDDESMAVGGSGSKRAGLVLDDMDETPWCIQDLSSCGTSW